MQAKPTQQAIQLQPAREQEAAQLVLVALLPLAPAVGQPPPRALVVPQGQAADQALLLDQDRKLQGQVAEVLPQMATERLLAKAVEPGLQANPESEQNLNVISKNETICSQV